MTESDQINQIINDIWPVQADILGPSTVRNISNNAASILPSDNPILKAAGGANFDPHSAAQLLIDAAVFVKISIEICKLLKNRNNKPPNINEFQKQIEADARIIKIPSDIKSKIPQIFEHIKSFMQ